MNDSLIMAALDDEQVAKAKQANGKNRRITHVVICGDYGRVFGTYNQCARHFSFFKNTFKKLFFEAKIVDSCRINDYQDTFEIENVLFAKIYEKEKRLTVKNKIQNHPKPPKSHLILSRRMKKADLY